MAQLNIRTQSKIYDPNFRYDTHIEILDMDEECIKDIIHGNGFYIEEPQSIKKDLKSENSIFSSRFGALTGDDTFELSITGADNAVAGNKITVTITDFNGNQKEVDINIQ